MLIVGSKGGQGFSDNISMNPSRSGCKSELRDPPNEVQSNGLSSDLLFLEDLNAIGGLANTLCTGVD